MKMKVRSLITMSLIAGSLILSSCADSKKEKEETVAEDHHEMNQDSKKNG